MKYKIAPQLSQLRRRLENLKLKLPYVVLEKFKDPKSYTPLIGTIFGGIPAQLAILLSMGTIALSTAYEYVLSRQEIKDNGLYYLISLDKKFG